MGGGGQIISQELKDQVKRMAGEEEKKRKRVSHAGLHVTSQGAMLTFQLSAFHWDDRCFVLHMECHIALTAETKEGVTLTLRRMMHVVVHVTRLQNSH